MSILAIESHNLSRSYGSHRVVDDLNLAVPKGSVYGFLGPNGTGKTTTIRMLLGLIKPSAGHVSFFGKPFRPHRIAMLAKIGSLVESPSAYGHLTGRENLSIIRSLLGAPVTRVQAVLDQVRLSGAADRRVSGYSLGMRQRLGIATALLGEPEIVILDEPTNGLDPSGIQEIRSLIVDLATERDITVMVSSHLLSEIDQMATQVGILSAGRLVFQDEISALRRRSRPRLRIGTDHPRHAASTVAALGYEPDLDADGSVWLEPCNSDLAIKANRALVHAGIGVHTLQEHHPSLEDIFIDLTGSGLSL